MSVSSVKVVREPLPADFRRLSLAMAISMLGSQGTAFAFSVWAVQRSNGPTWWSLVLFTNYAGAAIGSLLVGRRLDRAGPGHMLRLCLWGGISITAVECALLATGLLQPWVLVLTTLLSGVVVGVQQPAYVATTSSIVPARALSRAQGIVGTNNAVALVLAPAIAGGLLAVASPAVVLGLDIASYLVAMVLFGRIRAVARPQPTTVGAPSTAMGEVVTFLRSRKPLLVLVLLLTLTTMLLNTRYSVRVPMVLDRSNHGTQLLALIQAISAVAGIVGGLLLAHFGTRGADGLVAGICVIAEGLGGQLLTGLNSPVAWIVGASTINFFAPVLGAVSTAMLQAGSPPAMRGRMAAFLSTMLGVVGPIAVLTAGPLGEGPAHGLAVRLAGHGLSIFGDDRASGMSLVLVTTGLAAAAVGMAALVVPGFRKARAQEFAAEPGELSR